MTHNIMFKIIVGCYEQFVLGYNIAVEEQNNETNVTLTWDSQFSDHSQLGCIKCVASNNTLVVSGSTDESVCLYNMKDNCQLGTLQGHSGAINSVSLPDEKHLISCGDDGNICVWDMEGDGKLLKTLRGHKGSVLSFAIHPTGKLGMSTSLSDGTLRTWNMINGRSAYVRNTRKTKVEFVVFSPDGAYYITASSRFIQIYQLSNAKCCLEMETADSIMTLQCLSLPKSAPKFIFLAVGYNTGYISVFTVPSGVCVLKYKAHENRVKDICSFTPNFNKLPMNEVWMVSVSSDEKIKVWKFNTAKLSETKETADSADCVLTIDASVRLTCVTVWQDRSEENNTRDVAVEEKVDERLSSPSKLEKNEISEGPNNGRKLKIDSNLKGQNTDIESKQKRGRKRTRSLITASTTKKR